MPRVGCQVPYGVKYPQKMNPHGPLLGPTQEPPLFNLSFIFSGLGETMGAQSYCVT